MPGDFRFRSGHFRGYIKVSDVSVDQVEFMTDNGTLTNFGGGLTSFGSMRELSIQTIFDISISVLPLYGSKFSRKCCKSKVQHY